MITILTVSKMGEIVRQSMRGDYFEIPQDLYERLAEVLREAKSEYCHSNDRMLAKEKYDRIETAATQLFEARLHLMFRRYHSPGEDRFYTPEERDYMKSLDKFAFDFRFIVMEAYQ